MWRNGTLLASPVVHGVSGHFSSCVWNPRVFADDARGWQCPFVLDAGLLEPPERPQGSPASSSVWREDPGLLSRPYRMHACIAGGNGNPLQYSCLENPRDRGAWLAAVYGVTQSQTGLMRLSSISSSY